MSEQDRALRVESSLSRSTRLALEFGTVDQLRQLCVYQAEKIHRLTLGRDIGFPAPSAPVVAPVPEASPDALAVVERVLGWDNVFRKPPRVAAPRMLAHLSDLGYRIERT